MRYLIVLILLFVAFSSALMAEENVSFRSLYEALPSEPSQENADAFAKKLMELAHSTVQKETDFSAKPLTAALSFLGIEGCDSEYVGKATKGFATPTTVIRPPYKAWVMLAALYRCTLAVKPEPADEKTQLLAASVIRTHIWGKTLRKLREQSGDDGVRMLNYCEILASIAVEYDFENRYDILIDKMAGELPYDTVDKWEGLDDWSKATDSMELNMVELAAHLQWLYRNFTLDECLRDEIPKEVDRKTAWPKGKMILLFANPRYMTATEKQIENSQASFWRPSLHLRTIRIADVVLKAYNNTKLGVENRIGGSNNLLHANYEYFNYTYFVANPYRALLQEWKLKGFAREYKRLMQVANGRCKIKKVDEGSAGPGWFMGAQMLSYGVPCEISSDHVYPHVFVEYSKDIFGFDWMLGLCGGICFRNKLLAQIDGYGWSFLNDPIESCSLAYSVEVNNKLLCDLENGFDTLMAPPWRDTFVRGLVGINEKALSPTTVPTMFDPAPFYLCDKTSYQIYEFWDYDEVVGEVMGRRPICVLSVSPAKDAKVIDTKAGIIKQVLNRWYMNSLILPIKIEPWHLLLFRESQKPLFDEVHARIAKIRSTFEEDYKKSFEEYAKKRREVRDWPD